MFALWVALCAVGAGSIASVAGFGIGSILTPLLSLTLSTKLAVAVVSIPHFIATFIRFWMLRAHVHRKVLLHFGVMSALGGLIGALLHVLFATQALTLIFGVILIFSGIMGVSGLSERLRFGRKMAWIAGAVSGGLGGLVGNQGGIRSAALMSFNLSKNAFVATATAIGLIVDAARMPIYLAGEHDGIFAQWKLLCFAMAGVIVGTFVGSIALKRIPERFFRKVVSCLILLLGIYMFSKGMAFA